MVPGWRDARGRAGWMVLRACSDVVSNHGHANCVSLGLRLPETSGTEDPEAKGRGG